MRLYHDVDLILIAAAVLPAVVLLLRVYRADRLEPEPLWLLGSLVLRGIVATALAMVGERLGAAVLGLLLREGTLAYNALLYFGVVALSEEGAKYLLLYRRTWNSPHFNCQFDGVVYAVFVSLGFALWENIGYVALYGFGTAVLRAVTAVPGHACFGVFMGMWYGLARRYARRGEMERSRTCRRRALLLSVLLHGAYDFIATLPLRSSGWLFAAFVVAMFLSALRTVRTGAQRDRYI